MTKKKSRVGEREDGLNSEILWDMGLEQKKKLKKGKNIRENYYGFFYTKSWLVHLDMNYGIITVY